MSYKPYRSRTSNEGWLTSYADLITNLLIFFILIISASQIQTGKLERIVSEFSSIKPKETLAEAKKKVDQALREQQLDKDVNVVLTDDGLEVAFNSGVMFSSGKASILPDMEQRLAKVLQVIKPYSTKYKVA